MALLIPLVPGSRESRGAGSVIQEPSDALVAIKSIARLPDGRTILMIPSKAGRQLVTSLGPSPVTLEDYKEPVQIFGRDGALEENIPDSLAMAAVGNDIHLVFSRAQQLTWASTSAPVTAGSKWKRSGIGFSGHVKVEDLVADSRRVYALLTESVASSGTWNLSVALQQGGAVKTAKLASGPEALYAVRGALADRGALDVVWTNSELTPRTDYLRWHPEMGPIIAPRTIHAGLYPSIVTTGGRTFIASEQVDGSIRVRWREAEGFAKDQRLVGRAGFRPVLATDEHGIVWLFAVGLQQRGLFYRRFLGTGFGPESECGGSPGAWKLSLGYSVESALNRTQDGFGMLIGEYAGVEYRYRFQSVPVARYSVQDSRHVLFLDLLEVAEMENIQQKVTTATRSESNPLQLNGPPGSHDAAWAAYATVLVEQGKFRMWYNSNTDAFEREWAICYAESADGIHWAKPELGLAEYKGSKKNNLLFPIGYNTSTPLVILDGQDSDSARRYKMVFESKYEGSTGVYLSWSADGIHWQWPPHRLWGKAPGRNRTVAGFNPWHEPLSSFFYDPLARHPDYRWKIYGQDSYVGYPHIDERKPRNLSLVLGATPYDFKAYEGNPVLEPRSGHEEDQIHGGLVQPYHGLYIGLYQHWAGPDWNVDLRLAVSRDGLHFVRVQPQTAVLPLGPPGSWDSGMLCTPNFFFVRDDKIWLYYRGSVGTLATGRALSSATDSPHQQTKESWRMMTGLARLRSDGFAFLTVAPMERLSQPPDFNVVPRYRIPTLGRLMTIPVDASGIERLTLHLNVENLAPGFAWVRAQLRDADSSEVIPGYGFTECDSMSKASLDHVMTWRGSSDLSRVKAGRVRLELQLFGTLDSPQLYSFWFGK